MLHDSIPYSSNAFFMDSEQTSSTCPFGAELQVYWDMRYKLFEKFDQAQVDAAGLYTMIPEAYALDMARRASGSRSLDICAGIGSMSIALARTGQQLTAVEIDPDRVSMARHNAELYGVSDQIDFLAGDITNKTTLQSLPGDIHSVFLDPPWGTAVGEYIRRPIIRLQDLQLAGMDLRELIRSLDVQEVIMRLPQNFDIGIMRQAQGEKLAYVTPQGYLHWYFIRMPKEQFIGIPDRSPPALSMQQARQGFSAHLVKE